jgi:hypothetical protein
MVEAEEEQPVVSHYPKRKRASVYNDLSEDKIENSMIGEEPEPVPRSVKPMKRHVGSIKGVSLGYWRDSPVPDEKGKHGVIGFIDVRDRLRTRIQAIDRFGGTIDPQYPLPPGPGGSWVTFERVVFWEHLVGLDHYQVKEYVKLRTDQHEPNEAARKTAELQSVKDALKRCLANPPPDNQPAPAIAYGPEIPEHAQHSSRPEKRRRTGSGIGTIGAGGPIAPAGQTSNPGESVLRLDPIPGTRPTRILLGYWRGSSEPDPRDRHAVYGILGQNDMFRVKVVRETRDGRFVDGNFPSGAGALWIHYEEVEFENHLKNLSRTEIKEYCRIRQRQIDDKELPDQRIANETQAVFQAQQRASVGYKTGNFHPQPSFAATPLDDEMLMEGGVPPAEAKADFGGHELRQSRRAESRADSRPPRTSLPDLEMRQASRQSTEAVERTNSLARREIARVEAAQNRVERHSANREAAAVAVANAQGAAALSNGGGGRNGNGAGGNLPSTKLRFGESDDIQRLNTVWAKQEAHRLKAGSEEAKIYGGIKYERKAQGPFSGKLVSQGTIISIDGEDYVEYRVLTKPSFF